MPEIETKQFEKTLIEIRMAIHNVKRMRMVVDCIFIHPDFFILLQHYNGHFPSEEPYYYFGLQLKRSYDLKLYEFKLTLQL